MKVVLLGYGRMGKEVHSVLLDMGIEIVGKITKGDDFEPIKFCDVVIEFALPEATIPGLEYAKKYGKKYILGTTGHNEEQIEIIKSFGNHIPIVHSPNFSIGVALLKKAIKSILPYITDWDVEICEIHHKWKKDAPSGTALSIASLFARRIIANRTGKREEGEIGVFGLRGGDVFGEHTVFIFSEGERIELTHRLSSRRALAKGVVMALEFIKDKDKGYYTFDDIFQL